MKVSHKFYVGSDSIGTENKNGWAFKTSLEAVKKAQRILIEDLHRDEVIIVKIVGVVRRKPQFSIEKVS
jgi:hypothetical protein